MFLLGLIIILLQLRSLEEEGEHDQEDETTQVSVERFRELLPSVLSLLSLLSNSLHIWEATSILGDTCDEEEGTDQSS